jgi:hypothetical protein
MYVVVFKDTEDNFNWQKLGKESKWLRDRGWRKTFHYDPPEL